MEIPRFARNDNALDGDARACDFQTGGPHTAHTTNPVPFIMVAENSKQFSLKPNGSLRDISPTVLGMLGVPQPKEMTGHDLRVKNG